jgi:hypothetical protein
MRASRRDSIFIPNRHTFKRCELLLWVGKGAKLMARPQPEPHSRCTAPDRIITAQISGNVAFRGPEAYKIASSNRARQAVQASLTFWKAGPVDVEFTVVAPGVTPTASAAAGNKASTPAMHHH